MHAEPTSLKSALTQIGWDRPVTKGDLEALDPMRPAHPWLVAVAWYILCMIAPMDGGGLTELQTRSLIHVWLHPLPCRKAEIDPDLFVFAEAFFCSWNQRDQEWSPEPNFARTAVMRILGAYSVAMMNHCKRQVGQMVTRGSDDKLSLLEPQSPIKVVQMKALRVYNFCTYSDEGANLEGAFESEACCILKNRLDDPSSILTELSETRTMSFLDAWASWAFRHLMDDGSGRRTESAGNGRSTIYRSKAETGEVFQGLMTDFETTLVQVHGLGSSVGSSAAKVGSGGTVSVR